MSGFVAVYQCMDCSLVAAGAVNASEPPGWGYDWDECDWVCPQHAVRLPDEVDE